MKALLLYKDREWENPEYYYDERSIESDLGLQLLFTTASQTVNYECGDVKNLSDPDPFIKETMRRVVLTPLHSAEEITYRQKIVSDFLNNEKTVRKIYRTVEQMLKEWDGLGRLVNTRNHGRDNTSKLITRIHEFRLFMRSLNELSQLFEDTKTQFKSEGMKNLFARFEEEFTPALRHELEKISNAISFYVSDQVEDARNQTMNLPKIVLECNIGVDGRYENFKIKDMETEVKKYRDPKSAVAKVQGVLGTFAPDSVACDASMASQKQAAMLEFATVRYVMSFVEPFMHNFEYFFDALHFQMSFYIGTVNTIHHMGRFELDYCFPTVCAQNKLHFANLKEYMMCIGQRVKAVGNTCNIDPKMLIIVTGANQGGKSTFLRSIGIAQVMMQCGMPVAATVFESGLFPSLFMHFTRREDSQMNSGRLDEELGRMDQIIRNLGPNSLILLNESFATTTEKDGSVICYDIIKALNEAGVKIITVTHLLSFAQKIHGECKEKEDAGQTTDVSFLCAERMPDGSRTFRMIQSVPELTSFGLDLYDQIIGRG